MFDCLLRPCIKLEGLQNHRFWLLHQNLFVQQNASQATFIATLMKMAGFDWKFRTSVHFLPYFKTFLRKDIPCETSCIKMVVQGVVFSWKTTVQYGHMQLNEKVCWWGCDLLEKKVIDLLSDEGSESQKLSVYPMQHSLEKIALSWVFTVEQLQKLKHELLINHFFANTWLEVRRLEKPEEKLVHKLKVESKHTNFSYYFRIHCSIALHYFPICDEC